MCMYMHVYVHESQLENVPVVQYLGERSKPHTYTDELNLLTLYNNQFEAMCANTGLTLLPLPPLYTFYIIPKAMFLYIPGLLRCINIYLQVTTSNMYI